MVSSDLEEISSLFTVQQWFTVALFIITKLWKQPKYPLMDERIKIVIPGVSTVVSTGRMVSLQWQWCGFKPQPSEIWIWHCWSCGIGHNSDSQQFPGSWASMPRGGQKRKKKAIPLPFYIYFSFQNNVKYYRLISKIIPLFIAFVPYNSFFSLSYFY